MVFNSENKRLRNRCMFNPLKDGDRGSYSHFPDHIRPIRTPRVNVEVQSDGNTLLFVRHVEGKMRHLLRPPKKRKGRRDGAGGGGWGGGGERDAFILLISCFIHVGDPLLHLLLSVGERSEDSGIS